MSETTSTTKDRLLDAAEELIAAKGFDQVSIRDLASAAEVNVAAVNYHFQGKDNLFQQVVERRFVHQRTETLRTLQAVIDQARGRPRLEDVISTLVRSYLQGTLGSPKQVNFLSLIAGDMTPASPQVHETFFKEMVAPVYQAFSRALTAAHPRLREEQLTWIIASIVGQIHHLAVRWKKGQCLDPGSESFLTMSRIFPAVTLPVEEYIAQVTRHITQFSSAAIGALYPEDQQ